METFKDYEGYQIGNLGTVIYNGEVLHQTTCRGYRKVSFKGRQESVHLLVGRAFPEVCGKARKNTHLHHLNGIKSDNRAENLRYMTDLAHRRLHQEEKRIPVKQVDISGRVVGRYRSIYEASSRTGINKKAIGMVVSKKRKRLTAGGYFWFGAGEKLKNIRDYIKIVQLTKYQRVKREHYS